MPKIPKGKSVRIRLENFGILPCVKTTSLRPEANLEEHVSSDMLRPRKSLAKSRRFSGAKGSVALLKEATQLGCVSHDSYPRKSLLREEEKLGSKHAVKFSKGTWHQIIIRERVGPPRGTIQKCEPQECGLCAPKLGERSLEETLHQERCARRVAWDLAKSVYKLKKYRKSYVFTFLLKPKQCRKTGGTKIRSRLRSINAHDEQNRIKLR